MLSSNLQFGFVLFSRAPSFAVFLKLIFEYVKKKKAYILFSIDVNFNFSSSTKFLKNLVFKCCPKLNTLGIWTVVMRADFSCFSV